MRRTLLLIPLLALAACAGPTDSPGIATANGGATPTASAASAPSEGDPLKFAQCMRENGVPDFKDPDPDQKGFRVSIERGSDKATVDKAVAACKQYMPNGGEPPKLDAETLAQLREHSKCMRENGVPGFPDPQPDGRMEIRAQKGGNLDPESDAFQKADQKCSQFRPDGPTGGSKRVTGG